MWDTYPGTGIRKQENVDRAPVGEKHLLRYACSPQECHFSNFFADSLITIHTFESILQANSKHFKCKDSLSSFIASPFHLQSQNPENVLPSFP